DEQDNNTDDDIEHDNFGEGSTSSSTSRLRGNFRKNRAKMSKSKHVAFLPPNTTSHLQPLDAGIIASFKAHYKQNYCRFILELFEDGMDINQNKLTIKHAIDHVVDAWSN
ncbi:8286_t:CDS:2, partial [Gigaspora rosea]